MIGKGSEVLSDFVIYDRYAGFVDSEHRRETWKEVCKRYRDFMASKYPLEEAQIDECMPWLENKQALPSSRLLQFAGVAADKNPARAFNCAYIPIIGPRDVAELFWLSLSGCGVGLSVQKTHTFTSNWWQSKPEGKPRRWLVADSIEGWADAVRILLESYKWDNPYARPIEFDYRDVRRKGARIRGANGYAPGHKPLERSLERIRAILHNNTLSYLTPLQLFDICCHAADAAVSGGVRRSALITLFDADDEEMLNCKTGEWWKTNPQRARSNNSAVLVRGETTEEDFFRLWKRIEESGTGDPAFLWTNSRDFGTNPCAEVGLRPYQFCCLSTVNMAKAENEDDLATAASVATYFGTLQAGLTDFNYLRPEWRDTAEEDALVGVSLCGTADTPWLTEEILKRVSSFSVEMNQLSAYHIGINSAARCTVIKPEGTASKVFGAASGCHTSWAPFYIQRVKVTKDSPIHKYLLEKVPTLVEDSFTEPESALLSLPIRAKGMTRQDETNIEFLERIKTLYKGWILPGHVSGDDTNNVSATVSVKDGEWEEIGRWCWKNRDSYRSISFFPYYGGTHKQMPWEECTEEVVGTMEEYLAEANLDFSEVKEKYNTIDRAGEVACVGGECELF